MGVPPEAGACHTGVVDGYVVEGHVPVEAIAAMLDARPDARGVAVPGMPPRSPGMSDDPSSWADLPVFLIGEDGSLTPFED